MKQIQKNKEMNARINGQSEKPSNVDLQKAAGGVPEGSIPEQTRRTEQRISQKQAVSESVGFLDKKARLTFLKEQIAEGHKWLLVWSDSLKEIRDNRLFEEEGYENFESFCNVEWGYTPQYANRIIASGETIRSLPQHLQKHIANESQARALAKAPVEDRAQIVEVIITNGTVAPLAIAEKVEEKKPKKEKAENAEFESLDPLGVRIPKAIQEEWNRAEEIGKDYLSKVSIVRSALKEEDSIFGEVSEAYDIANSLYSSLKQITPYCVCVICIGKGCKVCHKRGFMSKVLYKNSGKTE